ncbi:MAG: CatA-like O-acetyltransferase [Pseudomonadota bacterium]
MTGRRVDPATWPGAPQFELFRGYDKPHYTTTARVDVSRLKARGGSPFRSALWAIGAGLISQPELMMRFQGDEVTLYDQIVLSSTIDLPDGTFRFSYFEWDADFTRFDAYAADHIAEIRAAREFNPNSPDHPCMSYLSCMPWLDYTSIDSAMPSADDCIPRVSWGKIMDHGGGRFDMAMSITVHHALVHGRQVGGYFAAVQNALDTL